MPNEPEKQRQSRFWLIVPAARPELEKCLLSIKGQVYQNYQAVIMAANDGHNLPSLFARLSLPKDKFTLIASPADLKILPYEPVMDLGNGSWLAHAHVLAQMDRMFTKDKGIGLLNGSMKSPFSPGLVVVAPNVAHGGKFLLLPDMALASDNCATISVECLAPDARPGKRAVNNSPRMALFTCITPDFLTEAVLSLASYNLNAGRGCEPHIFISVEDGGLLDQLREALPGFRILNAASLKYQAKNAHIMAKRYHAASNEYRWAMKSVVMSELLQEGYDFVLHLDPDLYTVDAVGDLQRKMLEHDLSLFPHFRDPDMEESRKLLYADGFFNGGMFGATVKGLGHLERLTGRCQREMVIDRKRNLFCEQKYLEWFIFEVDSLFINKDKGINYTIWNSDRMLGVIAPGQRSYLLQSGYFARVWHMQADFMKSVIAGDARLHWARPMIVWYILARAYLFLLLRIRSRALAPLLEKRFHACLTDLALLAGKEKAIPLAALANEIFKSDSSCRSLELLGQNILASISFDNFALYAEIMEKIFPPEPCAAELAAELRRNDFRYVTHTGDFSPEYDLARIQEIMRKRAWDLAEWGFI